MTSSTALWNSLRSRVFISCGQHSPREIQIARMIVQLLDKHGLDSYVAKEVQNVFEINSGIIGELKNSDCYLLVNFCREQIIEERVAGRGAIRYRGSLFSNQEFAIAYALGFDRIIVVNENGVKTEGMLRYIGCNTKTFETDDECLAIVEGAISRWEPTYSRRLMAENVAFDSACYTHFTGEVMNGRFLSLDIANRRPDIAAIETSGRLVGFRRSGEKDWASSSSHHRSLLKASGRSSFSHTVFPQSCESFNILFMGSVSSTSAASADGVYLNSALDLIPNPSLPLESGDWELLYEFQAIGFPLHRVEVSLRYTTFNDSEAELLRQYSAVTSAEVPRGRKTIK